MHRSTQQAIQALGGGRCAQPGSPCGVIAAFTATLLAAVMEDRSL